MTSKHTLNAELRDVFGKKINKYRKQGKVPGNIYGKVTKPTSVWFKQKDAETLLKEVSESALIDIIIAGEKRRPVVLRSVQHRITNKEYIHIDAQQVNLKEKIQVMVPIEITGESEAAVQNIAIVDTQSSEVEVEALPTDLPEQIIVDITNLKKVGDRITASDIILPKHVELLSEPDTVIVALVEPQSEEDMQAKVEIDEISKEVVTNDATDVKTEKLV